MRYEEDWGSKIEQVRSWSPQADMQPDQIAGDQLVYLAANSKAWVRRRVESVRFSDVSTIRRQISIDFDTRDQTKFPEYGGAICVPVTRLVKRPLSNFDLQDEDGRPVAALTTEENGLLTWSMLVSAAEWRLGTPPPPTIVRDLYSVTFARADLAPVAEDWVKLAVTEADVRAKLFADSWFEALCTQISSDFVLFAVVEPRSELPRRVLKYGYDEPAELSQWTLGRRLGWDPIPIEFEVSMAGYGASYHFEFEVPPGLQIVRSEIFATSGDGVTTREPRISESTSRAHRYLDDVDRYSNVQIVVEIRPESGGMLLWGMLTSCAIAILLLMAGVFSGQVQDAEPDSAVALLLVVPAVIATLIVRPDEHALASALLRWLRGVILAAGLSAFLAAIVIALQPSAPALRTWMLLLAVVPVSCSAMLAVAVYNARPIPRPKRVLV